MADSIYIKDFGEIEKLLQENKTQKSRNEHRISFVCSKCGKKTQMALGRFLFRDDLLCRECNIRYNYFKKTGYEHPAKNPELIAKRKRTNLMKYGYENPSSNPDIIKKAKQTKLSKYGHECFNNREKFKKTCLEKYGVENISQTEEVKDMVKHTNLERYGVPCSLQNEDVREKGRQTNLKKRGVEYACQSKDVIDKRKKNYLEKTGYENPLQNPEVIKRIQATNIKRYGVTCPLHNERIQEKVKKTNLERYGVEYNLQSEQVKEKIRKTNFERYGATNPVCSEQVKEKMKKTNLERYGVEYALQHEDFKDKARNTMNERYGCDHPMHNDEMRGRSIEGQIASKKVKRNGEDNQSRIRKAIESARLSVIGVDLVDGEHIYRVKCDVCGHEFKYSEYKKSEFYKQHPFCPECSKQGSSIQERELLEYIKSITKYEVVHRDRTIIKPKELDIVVPALNIAFEYDGLFYHNNIDNSYKFFECANKGVRLIQINEHEWMFKKEKVKSFLRKLFGFEQDRVLATFCMVREISTEDFKKFTEENSLIDQEPPKYRYGLTYKGELVEVIGLDDSNDSYKLSVVCTKNDVEVVGGLSKLICAFRLDHFGRIWAFCDMAKHTGKSLIECGFVLVDRTKPNCRYYSNNEELSVFRCKELFGEGFEESNTDVPLGVGYYRLFDYGSYVFSLDGVRPTDN